MEKWKTDTALASLFDALADSRHDPDTVWDCPAFRRNKRSEAAAVSGQVATEAAMNGTLLHEHIDAIILAQLSGGAGASNLVAKEMRLAKEHPSFAVGVANFHAWEAECGYEFVRGDTRVVRLHANFST